jgi:hypothetical protein
MYDPALMDRSTASRTRQYTLDEARALVPGIRGVLLQLAVERRRHTAAQAALAALDRQPGAHDGAARGRHEAEMDAAREAIGALLAHFEELGVELRDAESGLVDIPTRRDGEPAWFCWRLADPELAYWHTTREGFASRRPL